MGFRRFLAWLVEKLFELHLAIAAVLLVKFFLPLSGDAYISLEAFAAGVRDTYAGALDDAAYVAANFLGGSYLNYAVQTYLASAFVVVKYAYLSSLYIFLSLLACLLGRHHYVRNALAAFGFAALIFGWRFVHAYDADMLRMVTVVLVLGAGAVWWSASMGEALYHRWAGKAPPAAPPSAVRRVRLDLGA